MHAGIDTVSLEGKPFSAHAEVVDHVEQGQLLLDIDLTAVAAAGSIPVTSAIIANMRELSAVEGHVGHDVKPGDALMTLFGALGVEGRFGLAFDSALRLSF